MRAHVDAQIAARDAAAMRRWADLGPQLCELVGGGTRYGEALETLEVTAQAVVAHRHRDPAFAARIDAALTVGRDPQLTHGSWSAWHAQCRCPECREVHEASRQNAV